MADEARLSVAILIGCSREPGDAKSLAHGPMAGGRTALGRETAVIKRKTTTMSILKGALYVTGALAIGVVGIYAGWELSEKYGASRLSLDSPWNGGDDGGIRRDAGSPIRPPSSGSPAPSGEPWKDDTSSDGLGAVDVDAIRGEIAKIIEKVTPRSTEAKASL